MVVVVVEAPEEEAVSEEAVVVMAAVTEIVEQLLQAHFPGVEAEVDTIRCSSILNFVVGSADVVCFVVTVINDKAML